MNSVGHFDISEYFLKENQKYLQEGAIKIIFVNQNGCFLCSTPWWVSIIYKNGG